MSGPVSANPSQVRQAIEELFATVDKVLVGGVHQPTQVATHDHWTRTSSICNSSCVPRVHRIQRGLRSVSRTRGGMNESGGHHNYDSLACFAQAYPTRVRHVEGGDASDCHMCRKRFMVTQVHLDIFEPKRFFEIGVCVPQVCLSWQIQEFVRSLTPGMGRRSWVGPPRHWNCHGRIEKAGSPMDVLIDAAPAQENRLALCLYGRDERLDIVALQSLWMYVVRPSAAPVFAFIDSDVSRQRETKRLLDSLLHPKRLLLESPVSTKDLLERARGDMNMNAWERLNRLTSRMSAWLHHIYKINRCWELVRSFEVGLGSRFELVMGARLDLIWLASPPLHLMHKEALWIPDGQDWGGFNDRWAVVGRPFAETWFCRWEAVMHGFLQIEVPRMAPEAFNHMSKEEVDAYPPFGPELFLARAIEAAGLCPRIQRFPSTAALRCPEWSLGGDGPNSLMLDNARRKPCTAHGFRQAHEAEDAHNIAKFLEDGWEWSAQHQWRLEMRPDFFHDAIFRDDDLNLGYDYCCLGPQRPLKRFSSCSGYLSCFGAPTATYHRMCHDGKFAISLKPPSSYGYRSSCWLEPDGMVSLCLLQQH